MQITDVGRKRVASRDFCKGLVHIVGHASSQRDIEYGFSLCSLYTALNLLADNENFIEIPVGTTPTDEAEAAVLADFCNANRKEIVHALKNAMSSPHFVAHAVECWGVAGAEEFLGGIARA